MPVDLSSPSATGYEINSRFFFSVVSHSFAHLLIVLKTAHSFTVPFIYLFPSLQWINGYGCCATNCTLYLLIQNWREPSVQWNWNWTQSILSVFLNNISRFIFQDAYFAIYWLWCQFVHSSKSFHFKWFISRRVFIVCSENKLRWRRLHINFALVRFDRFNASMLNSMYSIDEKRWRKRQREKEKMTSILFTLFSTSFVSVLVFSLFCILNMNNIGKSRDDVDLWSNLYNSIHWLLD